MVVNTKPHHLSTAQQNKLRLWHDYTPLPKFNCLLVRIATPSPFFKKLPNIYHPTSNFFLTPNFHPRNHSSIQIMDHYKLSPPLQFALLYAYMYSLWTVQASLFFILGWWEGADGGRPRRADGGGRDRASKERGGWPTRKMERNERMKEGSVRIVVPCRNLKESGDRCWRWITGGYLLGQFENLLW